MKERGKKLRLDLLLQERYPELSRSRIQAEIMAGRVFIDGLLQDKPGFQVTPDAELEIREPENPYVSRGGLKLEGALKKLSLQVDGRVILDVGASTGGFTDCLLQHGAAKVYALDVGYGQLAAKLRNDARVVVMERSNVRALALTDLPQIPDMAVIDVSFISLSHVFPVLANLKISELLALVKPQFEAGRQDADRGGGVIRDPELHKKILKEAIDCAAQNGYRFCGLTYSPKPGPKGNIEYFLHLISIDYETGESNWESVNEAIHVTVGEAHNQLKGAGKPG